MDIDEDDDFYGENGDANTIQPKTEDIPAPSNGNTEVMQGVVEEAENGDEEEDEEDSDDSDIDIITERKDGTKAPPPSNARYNEIRNIPQRTGSSDIITKQPPLKKESTPSKPALPIDINTADLPGLHTSTIDVDAKPIYDPAGKPITSVDIDLDLAEHAKPWRQPGTDITDFFNYGFDEFTWALYAAKQDSIRGEYDSDKIAANQKKMMEDMNMMMMGGMPGAAAMGGMGGAGMDGMPPEMQQMMQMMAGGAGADMGGMDPSVMMQMTGQQAGPQGFGGPQGGFGQQGGFTGGFDQGNNNGPGRGNFRGRGRGHRGW